VLLIGGFSLSNKRATSFDVAREAGVSRTTVSFVLNNVTSISISETTRQRVFAAAEKLNYHPDASGRKLVTGKSSTIGLVLRQSFDQIFSDAFLLQAMLGIDHAASQYGFNLLLKPLDPNHHNGYDQLVSENHVDGIILSGPRQDDSEITKRFKDGFPIVLMGQLEGSEIPFVDINAYEGAADATRHLIELGHRRIGMITNASMQYTSARQRRQGFVYALKKANLSFDESLFQEGDYTPASGFSAMNKLLENKEIPTAVFVASDVVATGAIQAIKNHHLSIPQDISVIGFDDIPMAAYFDPPLTTIRLPAYEIGREAGEKLIQIIRKQDSQPYQELLNTKLIIRESTGQREA
jgi:DNA-binding LacI/PurR family transcriptional regulator